MNEQVTSGTGWFRKEKAYRKHRGEAIGAIVWNIIWLWIINNLQEWDLSFILESFPVLLWIWNINALIQIVTNLGIAILDIRWLRHLLKAVMDASNFVSLIATFYLYPFNFSGFTGWGLTDFFIRIGLIIGMVVTAISVVVHTVKTFFKP